MLWIAAVIAAAASWVDLRRHEIPDGFPLALALCAATAATIGVTSWPGIAVGAGLGLGIGVVLFAAGAFGGGDAKLLAGIGACLGPAALLAALVPIAVAGGLLSLVALARGRRQLAYGPAIAAGLLLHVVLDHWGTA